MIEFYYKNFKSNYRSKIKQLINDIEQLLNYEKIEIVTDEKIVLNDTYKYNLVDSQWCKINKLYNTLNCNYSNISELLKKFLIKNKSNENKKYKFIDTFAGCGGLSLGIMNSGFNPVLINEIEKKYLETYYFNHDIQLEDYYCGDIKEFISDENYIQKYDDIDLVVGGPPCQGFSMANRQRLIDDPRNKLYKYYLELLRKVRPKFFIMENVKGMINKSNEILENFHSILGEEYTIDIILLNAKDFGVPQNRERVFVIGSRVKKINATDIIQNLRQIRGKSSIYKLKDALNSLPKLEPKTEKNKVGMENDRIGYKFRPFDYTLNNYFKFINNNEQINYLCNHTNRYNNDRDIKIFSLLPQGENSLHHSISEIMPYKNRNHMFKDKYYKLNEDDYSKTITSHMKLDCNMYIHPTQSRGLSPREAARIQTFPDDYVFMGANNTWYAQIGNAVPTKLAEVIGSEIMKKIKELECQN